ncbi:MAG: MFS transporter [Dehalococcoidia bacterium]|nr:MAG: MFS transporter [Dehalococcoidia bacterium]
MPGDQSGLRVALSALSHRDYRRFAASLFLTSIGVQLIQTAIFWQVYVLTGSALLLGLTGLARAGPHVILSMVGGVLADRLDRVRLIQAGQVGNALLVVALAYLTFTGEVQVWHLYAVTFLNSAFSALTQPARTALIPALIPPGNLVNAIALNATIGQTAQIAGPALAGVAIAYVDLGPVYLVNGLLYFVSMAVIAGVRVPVVRPAVIESPWRSFIEGLDFVRTKPVILSLLMLDVGATLFGSYRALLPVFAESLGVGPTGFGLLSAAPGMGALFGAAFILSLGDMAYKGLYTVFGVLAYCIALVVLALSPWFLLALLAAALLGATNSVQMIPRNSVILTISPNALRGRVESFRSMLAGGAPPLGYMLSGVLATAMSPVLALVVGALACTALVAGIGAWSRELRSPDLGSPSPGPAVAGNSG